MELFIKSGKFDLDDINFILTSDHGQALGEYNQIGHGYRLIPTPEVSKVAATSFAKASLEDKPFKR